MVVMKTGSGRVDVPPTCADADLEATMVDPVSDLVERKETFDGQAPNTVRQAICAFANDLPDRRRPGVLFIGVDDDGTPTGLQINDALLLELAHCKTDGNILPLPTMTVIGPACLVQTQPPSMNHDAARSARESV